MTSLLKLTAFQRLVGLNLKKAASVNKKSFQKEPHKLLQNLEQQQKETIYRPEIDRSKIIFQKHLAPKLLSNEFLAFPVSSVDHRVLIKTWAMRPWF